MNYYPEFSHQIAQALQREERSASWLAQRLGVSPSTVGRWLNDGMRPKQSSIVVQIADLLGMSGERDALLIAAGYGYLESTEATSGGGTGVNLVAEGISVPKLPAPATQLVGRVSEMATLVDWFTVKGVRLVTIVGPGGMGKTRLGLAVAAALLAEECFEHGVSFTDLSPLRTVDQLPAAISVSLGFPLDGRSEASRPAERQLLDFLQNRQHLLVLDNAEHLPECAELVANILQAAPGVQVLITSREPLRLPSEQLLPLQGLGLEDTKADPGTGSATALFLQSARRIWPDYIADSTELVCISEICRLVSGMPLAIELAASWIPVLSAGEILSAIRQSFQFLETDLRAVPERHRSMQAVFDSTWQRLSGREQQIFAKLSVFRGSFTLDAAMCVTGANLVQLRNLARSSLISINPDSRRISIHELLRQYGAQRLAGMADLQATANVVHSQYYIDVLTKLQAVLKAQTSQQDVQSLEVEFDNLSRAWTWMANHGQVKCVVDSMDGYGLFLRWRGLFKEGKNAFRLAVCALLDIGETQALARALAWQALFSKALGHNKSAAQSIEESSKIIEHCDSSRSDVRSDLAFVLMQQGLIESARDTIKAEARLRESLALFETLHEPWYVAEALLGIGHIYLTQGDFDTQRLYVQKALETYRTLGNVRGVASALSMLADIASYRGQLASGLDLGYQALAAFRAVGDPAGIATCLSRIGMTYIDLGDVVNARRTVLDSAVLFEQIGSKRDMIIVNAYLCAIELMEGDYRQAYACAQKSKQIADDLDDQLMHGVALSFLGFAQLYAGETDKVVGTLREAITVSQQTGATMELARSYALLGLDQWRKGQWYQARTYCLQSLRLAAQASDPWSLLTSISTAIAILADGTNPGRAVELHSMLKQDPLCAASRWYEDGVAPHVYRAIERLPLDVVIVAESRGKGLNQLAEATKLTDEMDGDG